MYTCTKEADATGNLSYVGHGHAYKVHPLFIYLNECS